MVRFIRLLRRLLLVLGSNIYMLLDYFSGLDLLLSVLLGFSSYLCFLITTNFSFLISLVFVFPKTCKVPAVEGLLHLQSATSAPSVISF